MQKSSCLPRFRKCSEAAPGMQLTDRDIEIVRAVATHRFLRSTHVHALLGGSQRQILKRLQLLFHHGYLDRPRAQIDRFSEEGGSRPIAYGLAKRGASLLRRVDDVPFEKMTWNQGGKSFRRLFLDHALLTSEVMVRFLVDGKNTPGMIVQDLEELHSPHRGAGWSVSVPGIRTVGVKPDRIFEVENDKGESILCFLEADRGTMPIIRSDLSKSSILRKLKAYVATWEQAIQLTQFQRKRFRVILVTESLERANRITEISESLLTGKGLFLSYDIKANRSASVVFR